MPNKSGLRVLLVEPSDDFRHVFTLLLELMGCAVENVTNANEAVGKLQASTPDIVVTELYLPDDEGMKLAQQIRLMPSAQGIVLVATTAIVRADSGALALQAGFDHFLVKPIFAEQVAELLQETGKMRNSRPNGSLH